MAAEFISSPGNPSGRREKNLPMTTDDTLWTFAHRLYARPGVEGACLALQAAGGDVCLLLAGAWLERRGTGFSHERLDELQRVSTAWREQVVRPARALRQAWRTAAQDDPQLHDLRERLKGIELDAERVQLNRLQAAAEHWSPGAGASDWLEPLSQPLGGDLRHAIATLRQAVQDQAAGEGDA